MKSYMEDEAVMQAKSALIDAIERASGDIIRNFMVVVQHHNVGGATDYEGCDCRGCAMEIIFRAATPFRGEAVTLPDDLASTPKAKAH